MAILKKILYNIHVAVVCSSQRLHSHMQLCWSLAPADSST